MRLALLRTFAGPSLYAERPVLLARLDLRGPAPDAPAVRALLDAYAPHRGDGASSPPVLHIPSQTEQLATGAPAFGMAFADLVRGLAKRAGVPCPFAFAQPGPAPDTCDVAIGYELEGATRAVVQAALQAIEALGAGEPAALEEQIEDARYLAEDEALGPSTRALVEAAERRGIPWERIGSGSLIRLGYGRHIRFIQASLTSTCSSVAADVASDKPLTKALLDRALLPVPRGEVVRNEAEALAAAGRIGFPVVVKPLYGNHGRGVSVGLATPGAVAEGYRIAREHGRRALVEEQLLGSDFRILVVGGKMVAACERRPCRVVGDGKHTIAELVEIENQDPRRGEGHAKAMSRIRLDEVVLAHLAGEGRSLDHVPAPGEVVELCRAANLSRGGTAHDVTDRIHPEVQALCERAARVVGLDVCGVDLVAEDITRPLGPKSGIVEVNAAPGLRMHLAPAEGSPRDVGDAILDALFPPGTPSRIPLITITGTNGKTTVTRLVAHALGSTGKCVGMTTTNGVFVGGRRVVSGDTSGPASARAALVDPAVDVAVLETARGGIVRRGLGYDWSDVAVLTKVTADHLGQDGLHTVDDLYRVKRLVAERVRPGGTLVLNAEDERLARLPRDPKIRGIERRVVFFALDPEHHVVEQHRAEGGTAFFARDGWLVEAEGPDERRFLRIEEVPITMGGAATFHVANALAAAAACRAAGLDQAALAEAFRTFRAATHNEGRANLFRLGEGYAFLDYGHNPDAFQSVCALASHWKAHGRRVTAIVGVPGDRDDAVLEAAARTVARGFDRVIGREDEDRRGRAEGETAELLCRAIQAERPGIPCEVELSDLRALEGELERIRQGEIVVVFYDHDAPLRTLLLQAGAVPADAVAPRVAEPATESARYIL